MSETTLYAPLIWAQKGKPKALFWQRLVPPEEDRHLFTTATWHGGFRWFRSPNVIPFEKYTRPDYVGRSVGVVERG